MNWYRIHALIDKDIREVLNTKMVVLPMIVVPLILCIVVPALLTVLGYTQGTAMMSGADMIEKVIPAYPVPEQILTGYFFVCILYYKVWSGLVGCNDNWRLYES